MWPLLRSAWCSQDGEKFAGKAIRCIAAESNESTFCAESLSQAENSRINLFWQDVETLSQQKNKYVDPDAVIIKSKGG